MKIPRISVVTLGVSDLKQSTKFYSEVLDIKPNTSFDGVTFLQLPGTWISLFPLENLAHDISPAVSSKRAEFSGMTIAHNAKSKEDVFAVFKRAEQAGAKIMKEPSDTFWGGFSGYFADPDGFCWEVAWGPMFEFTEDGTLKFKEA